jgi:hypothetical protein
MIGIIGQMNAALSAIEARKAAAIEEALQVAACPHCGGRVAAVRYQGFVEAGRGLTERLVGRCPAGHEWAVNDPAFRWVEAP